MSAEIIDLSEILGREIAGSVADTNDACNVIKTILARFGKDERRLLLTHMLGTEICEAGTHPSRSLSSSVLGPVVLQLSCMVDEHWNGDPQVFA